MCVKLIFDTFVYFTVKRSPRYQVLALRAQLLRKQVTYVDSCGALVRGWFLVTKSSREVKFLEHPSVDRSCVPATRLLM